MRGVLIDFGLAWRLLTILPWPGPPEDLSRPAGRAAGYYPLVGLLLGLLLAGVEIGLGRWLSINLTAALALALWVGLTGMLHLDGFMDSCDGLLPPREPARRLEIMKDSRVGAFGVVGVVLLLLLKFNGLAALLGQGQGALLPVILVLARWAITWVMVRYPLARREGLGVMFVAGLSWPQLLLASAVAVGAAVFWLGLAGLALLAVAWLTATLIAQLAVARIGGLTGDVYGAICEVAETGLLITAILAA